MKRMETPVLTTMTKQDCGCGCGGDCAGCTGCDGPVSLERTRFFPRQLVGPDDLTQDQRYFREKHRRHNRLLHGWGIVCGACVVPGTVAQQIVITPGYILGPYGDEILIDREVPIDLTKQNPTGALVDPCAAVDPWCSDVRIDRSDRSAWLVVRYAECDARPVAVGASGCGCEDADCEYSRTRDSFELRLLDEMPLDDLAPPDEAGAGTSGSLIARKLLPGGEIRQATALGALAGVGLADLAGALTCTGRGRAKCPPCPTSPWVVLARVTLASSGDVDIRSDPYRRYVASFGAYSFHCQAARDRKTTGRPQESKVSALIDLARRDEAAPPTATVAARTGTGSWVVVPGNFEVNEGETLGALLAREGDRTLVDPQTGDAIRLAELYAAAGADPKTKVDSVADALAPLEGERLDVPGLRVVRSQLTDLIDVKGLDKLESDHGGAPAAASELPATALRGIGDESVVGKAIAGKSVAQIAEQQRDAFVTTATKGARGAQKEQARADAIATWTAATRVARLAAAWRGEHRPQSQALAQPDT